MVGLLPEDQRPNCHYDLINPETDINYGKPEMGWRYDKNTMNRLIKDEKILWPDTEDGRPRRKKFLSELHDKYTGYSSIIAEDVYTRDGTEELKSMFGKKTIDFPKPSKLLEELVQQGLDDENGIVLDFFSGSSTTAHAVLNLNKKNSRNIKFIMVQLPEALKKKEAKRSGFKNIADISKERIRRVIKKIQGKNSDYDGDLGFKVFKLDSSNIKPWDPSFDEVQLSIEDSIENVKPDRSEKDLLYEILLKYGIDLSLPIEERHIADSKVYVGGAGALVLCPSDNIMLDVVEGIAEIKEELDPEIMRVVFRDSGFKDDMVKTNAVQILKQHGIEDVRSI